MAAKNAEFEAAIKAADTPYMKDVIAKKQECEWLFLGTAFFYA